MLMYTENFCRSIYRYRQIASCIYSYMDLEAQVTHLSVLILRIEFHYVPGATLSALARTYPSISSWVPLLPDHLRQSFCFCSLCIWTLAVCVIWIQCVSEVHPCCCM